MLTVKLNGNWGAVAQGLEQQPYKLCVVGSIPTRPIFRKKNDTATLVEADILHTDVEISSNLIAVICGRVERIYHSRLITYEITGSTPVSAIVCKIL